MSSNIGDKTKFMVVGMATYLIENGISVVKQIDDINNKSTTLYVLVERRNKSNEEIDQLIRTFKVQYLLTLMSAFSDNKVDTDFKLIIKYKIKEK